MCLFHVASPQSGQVGPQEQHLVSTAVDGGAYLPCHSAFDRSFECIHLVGVEEALETHRRVAETAEVAGMLEGAETAETAAAAEMEKRF